MQTDPCDTSSSCCQLKCVLSVINQWPTTVDLFSRSDSTPACDSDRPLLQWSGCSVCVWSVTDRPFLSIDKDVTACNVCAVPRQCEVQLISSAQVLTYTRPWWTHSEISSERSNSATHSTPYCRPMHSMMTACLAGLKQGVALTGQNSTDPPWNVTDDDRQQQTPENH